MMPEHAESVRVGFTGTRHGMTHAQRITVQALLAELEPAEVHHGDCVGADGEFHDLTHGRYPVIIHPPKDAKLRAWCDGDVLPEKPYLERNRDIVNTCDLLIATPQSMVDSHGGTWYTIKYARDRRKRVALVCPDGTTHFDGSRKDELRHE